LLHEASVPNVRFGSARRFAADEKLLELLCGRSPWARLHQFPFGCNKHGF
jgi:hypothetical protein